GRLARRSSAALRGRFGRSGRPNRCLHRRRRRGHVVRRM
ncbi:MAG: hypothetical protein AVDCRST_MAG19-651, partial [uncultured Thermomicrobiales bacterium]